MKIISKDSLLFFVNLLFYFSSNMLFVPSVSAKLQLSWDAPSGGGPVLGYRIYCGTESGDYHNSFDVGQVTQWDVLTDSPGGFFKSNRTYYCTIKAYNGSGESEGSREMILTVPDIEPISSVQDVFAEVLPNGSVKVSWRPKFDKDLGGYRLYYGIYEGIYDHRIDVGRNDEYILEKKYFEKSKKYYFRITVVDTSDNESAFSEEVSVYIK